MRNSRARRAAYRRRGTTLVELSIVVALISMIAVMTVSFCTLIGTYVQRTNGRYDLLHECELIRSEVSDWLSARDDAASTCEVAGDSLSIGGDTVSFSPGSHALRITDGGRTHNVSLDAVTDVVFSVGSDGADVILLKCTVTGAESDSGTNTMSFLLPFRIGGLEEKEAGGE